MSVPVKLTGGGGEATVTHAGQLHVAPYAYDEVVAIELTTINTAYNFYKPKVGYNFVITGILLGGDRNIGAAGSLVEVYEATTADSLTVDKLILKVDLLKQSSRDILPMNVLVPGGLYINAKMDDNNIEATITGYYITKEV